jgi:SPP1 family predicted phage head-tail adaptor
VQAGKLSHRVTLQRLAKSTPRNEAHEPLPEEWYDVATVWGRIRYLSGRELFYAQQVQAQGDVEVGTRYQASLNVTSADRWKYRDRRRGATRFFNILSVSSTDERGEDLVCRCTEFESDRVQHPGGV